MIAQRKRRSEEFSRTQRADNGKEMEEKDKKAERVTEKVGHRS